MYLCQSLKPWFRVVWAFSLEMIAPKVLIRTNSLGERDPLTHTQPRFQSPAHPTPAHCGWHCRPWGRLGLEPGKPCPFSRLLPPWLGSCSERHRFGLKYRHGVGSDLSCVALPVGSRIPCKGWLGSWQWEVISLLQLSFPFKNT